ncbi:MAG: hypothetical protein RL412_317 [Pseudomonadota bacterium]
MKNFLKLKLTAATLLIASCITINVYFPAGAAEKAADQIIDSVIQGGGAVRGTPQTPPVSPPTTTTPPTTQIESFATQPLHRVAASLIDALIPRAHAQTEMNLDVSSPEIRAITASMQNRFGQLERFFDAGVVGLTADGLIDIRDISAAALPDRALIKRLVAEDNADRNALYDAIARKNERPEWAPDIRRIFAQRWVERGAKPGWYFKDLDGNWKQR